MFTAGKEKEIHKNSKNGQAGICVRTVSANSVIYK